MHWDTGFPRNPFGDTSMPDADEIDLLRAQLARQAAEIEALNALVEAHDNWLEALDWLMQDVPAPA